MHVANLVAGPSIDHCASGRLEVAPQEHIELGRERLLVQRSAHVRKPALARVVVDCERGMTHIAESARRERDGGSEISHGNAALPIVVLSSLAVFEALRGPVSFWFQF